jgi:hypothetical protein
MKKICLFFFLSICISLSAQNRQALLKAAAIHANAKDTFLLRDSCLTHIYYDFESDSMLVAGLNGQYGLTQADVDYMLLQLKNTKPHTWSADSISGAVIVPASVVPAHAIKPKKAAKAWAAYFKKYNGGYYEISAPIFSKDGTYAIVYTGLQCGSNCGNGGATLFHWENGQWKPVKNLYAFEKSR